MKKLWLTVVMVLFTLGLVAQGPAQASMTQILSPEADSYVYQSFSNFNYGSAPELRVRRDASGLQKITYLRFDLADLGAITSADLLSATLNLYLSVRPPETTRRVPIRVSHVDNDAWVESSITWQTQAVPQPWVIPLGATMYTTPSGPVPGWVSFNLLSLGNGWVAGDLTDGELSLTLTAVGTSGSTDYQFYSRDNLDVAHRPYLTIEYSPVPLPPTVLLMGSGLLGLGAVGLRRRWRA